MWVWRLEEGFGVGNLKRREVALPEPGPGQVRLRTLACSLNYRDHLVASGRYNPNQGLPLVPLSDAVFAVDALGASVAHFRVGERVAATFAQRWRSGPPSREALRSTLGSPLPGVAAEYVVLDAEGLVAVPDYLTDAEAATLPCAAVTAWNALFEHRPLRPGNVVLLQGTGGVSLFALLFAKAAGARVIITSGSDEKLERAKALGADETLNYRREPGWGKSAKGLCGEGVDHVVEVGGAGTLEQSLHAVRPGGTISLIGVLAGGAAHLDLTRILMNAVNVQGIFVGPKAAFERMNGALASLKLRPPVDRTESIHNLPSALEALGRGEHIGKIALTAG